jgi:hypothetical protein
MWLVACVDRVPVIALTSASPERCLVDVEEVVRVIGSLHHGEPLVVGAVVVGGTISVRVAMPAP